MIGIPVIDKYLQEEADEVQLLIDKYNSNHDRRGRFASGHSSHSSPSEAKRQKQLGQAAHPSYKGRGGIHGYDTVTNHPIRELRRQPKNRKRRRVLDLETGKVRTLHVDRMTLGTL